MLNGTACDGHLIAKMVEILLLLIIALYLIIISSFHIVDVQFGVPVLKLPANWQKTHD